jgi:thioredoxin 2
MSAPRILSVGELIVGEEAEHIVCPNCNGVSRIAGGKDPRKAKCGHCHRPLFFERPVPVSAKSFATQIERNDIPVLVDFWAEWCGPCKAMAPVYERITAEFEPEVRFLKVDADAEPELTNRYNIRSIPTLMLFRNGRVIAQQAGAISAEALRSWLRRHAAPFSQAFQAH